MRDLLVPSRALAVAIAGEFAAQGEHVLPATTPLYNLASSAIDQFVHEDLAAAEDIEAEMRAARLSTFDRIAAAGAESGGGGAGGGGASGSSSAGGGSAGAAGAGNGADVLALARASEADAPAHARSMSTGRSEGGGMGGAGSGTSKLRDLALDYLETDSVCFRVDWDLSDPGERLLRKRQDKHYGPLLAWFAEAHGAPLAVAVGLEDARHPEAAFDAAEDAVDCADPWLKAFYSQTLGCLKSTVLAMALAHRAVDAEEAFVAARVEEEYQLESFGFVEDGHDTGRAYLRLQLTSAAAFLALLPKSSLPAPLPSAGAGASARARAAGASASANVSANANAGGSAAYEAALAAHVAARTARVAARRAREAALVERKRAAFRQIARDAAAAARA
jgi:chaperone required for assembly of F1-ATPase